MVLHTQLSYSCVLTLDTAQVEIKPESHLQVLGSDTLFPGVPGGLTLAGQQMPTKAAL